MRFPGFEGEWESSELGVIAEFSKGVGISKNQRAPEGNPCILYGELYTTYNTEIIDKVVSKTDLDTSGLVKSKANDIIIPASGETAVDIATARCVLKDNVLLGSDLNVVRLNEHDGKFFSYQLNGVRKNDIARIAHGVSIVHLHGNALSHIVVNYPSRREQERISSSLSLVDQRIAIQSKVIEDLKRVKIALCELFFDESEPNCRLGDIIEQVSERNKKRDLNNILSVSNRYGFIEQSKQFEDRTVASEDTSNYKIVSFNDFAYNPARINVGSIARLKNFSIGIISPMYICFRTNESVIPEYLESFFDTKFFSSEMGNRLEGSVRMCLSYEGLCNIPIHIPSLQVQRLISSRIETLKQKLSLEESILERMLLERQYLLSRLFV